MQNYRIAARQTASLAARVEPLVRKALQGNGAIRAWSLQAFIFAAIIAMGGGALRGQHPNAPSQARSPDPCAIRDLTKSDIQGLKIYAPDGKRYLIKKEDEDGISQVYFGQVNSPAIQCATCDPKPGGPSRDRFKMQPNWHPSGDWISLAVEDEEYSPPPILGWSRDYVEGQLQNGIWTNMYALSTDGQRWYRLTDFGSGKSGSADGFTGPAFTPDGRHAVWSQIIDGNILKYWPFGKWQLILADFVVERGTPRFTNLRDITPEGMNWNEPGNFSPDNVTFLFSGSDQPDAQGMDTYSYNIATGEVKNLNNSPAVWDEHAYYSPDGEKILFMSAYPYRDDPKASQVLSIKTEYMIMNKDGSDLRQLTHYREPGYPEYADGGIAADGRWSPDGSSVSLSRLFFPNFSYWSLDFEGRCGGQLNRSIHPVRSRTGR